MGFFVCILRFKTPDFQLPWTWKQSVCADIQFAHDACLKPEFINKLPSLFNIAVSLATILSV